MLGPFGLTAAFALLLGPAAPAEAPGAATPAKASAKAERAPLQFDMAALARFAVFAGDTRRLTQPFGYGFALNFGLYPWSRARTQLGFFVFGGHARAPELLRLPAAEDPLGPESPRWQRVTHTDFAAGVALRSDFERVYWGLQAGAGLAISQFIRPTEANAGGDQVFDGLDPLVRGRLFLGIPIRDRHALSLGLAFTKVFSGAQVSLDAEQSEMPEAESALPFDLVAEFDVGYQARF